MRKLSELFTSRATDFVRASVLVALSSVSACEERFSLHDPRPVNTIAASDMQPCEFVRRYASNFPACSEHSRKANNGSCELPTCINELIQDSTGRHIPALSPEQIELAITEQVRSYCAQLESAAQRGRLEIIATKGGYCNAGNNN